VQETHHWHPNTSEGEMVDAVSCCRMWGGRNDCFTCDLNGVDTHTTAESPRGCPDTVVASRPAAVAQAPHIGLAQLHNG
jgi:hypothetical protein